MIQWSKLVSRFGKGGAILIAILSLLLLSLVIYSMKAELPWGKVIQKRISKQLPLQAKEYAIIGLWWGSIGSSFILTLLLGTVNKWLPRPAIEQASTKANSNHRIFWIFTILAVLFSLYLRAPRLSHSLWNDEEYAMRRFSHGTWEPQKDGTSKFEPVSWTETLFDNGHGNNHLMASFVTRLSLDLWRSGTNAKSEAFSEAALRAPSLFVGLITIVIIALLGHEIGGTSVGCSAAFLMAISPWHVRYATESKGYSLMLFFICLNLYAIIRALKDDKIRWWLIFAISEAGYLLSFAGSIYVAVSINLLVTIELLRLKKSRGVFTLIAFNLIGAIPVIIWMFPSIPQILAYLKAEDSLRLGMGWDWTRDYFSGLAIGFQYSNPGLTHSGTSWLSQCLTSTWLYLVFFLWVAPIMLITGIVLSFSRNTASRLTILAPTIAGVMAYAHNSAQNNPMVVWYLLYTIIPVVFALPLAISFFGKNRPWLMHTSICLLVITYAALTWNVNQILQLHDRQPIRQTVATIKEVAPNAMTATFGVSDRQSQSYDPHVHMLESESELQDCINKSRDAKVPFYVYFCGATVSQQRRPDLMKRVAQSDEFTLFAKKSGHEELFSYQVYQLTPSQTSKPY